MILKRNSIKYRLTLISAVSFIIIGIVCVYFIIQIFTGYMREQTIKNAANVLQSFEYQLIEKNKEHILKHVKILANSPRTAEWIGREDTQMLDLAFQPYFEGEVVDFLMVRNHERPLIERRGAGVEFSGLFNARVGEITRNLNEASVWVDENGAQDLLIIGSAPVRNPKGEIVGNVTGGYSLARSGDVDRIKEIHELDATIFSRDIRIATTMSRNWEKQLGTQLEPEIAGIVLKEGNSFTGKTQILGKPYLAIYRPIAGLDGKPVGSLFVGKSMEEFLIKRNQMAAIFLLLGGLAIIFGIIKAEYWHNRMIVNPITKITKALRRITEGDWTIPADCATGKNLDEFGELSVSFVNLVHEMKGYRERVERIAYYDELTGLPNRACLYQKYNSGLGTGPSGGKSVLIYLDTDNLKLVNDVYGHPTGDQLLKSISGRIADLAKKWSFDTFRLWGDEFVLINTNCRDIREVSELARGMVNSFKEPFQTGGNSFRVSLSMGITISREQTADLAQMLKNAEIAMCHVKENGKNGFMFFDQSMDRILKFRVEMEQDLRSALKNQEFQLLYQPKIGVKSCRYEGFEALLRWEHPGKGWIFPDQFICFAEQTGLIVPIGEWVLKTACRFMKELNERMNSNYQISVNVSVLQLIRGDFVTGLEKILNDTGLSPQLLELEITESLLMKSPEVAFDHLLNLRDKGISIALDDFGKGYSSLTYLRQLPISTLKIDGSFVVDIKEKDDGYHQGYLVGDIIRLGHHMGLKVVAEGVETKSQLEYLRKNHCDLIQGYYFSKPLPNTEIISLLEKGLDFNDNLAI